MSQARDPQPVLSPQFWRERMYTALARGEIHRLMFAGTVDEMKSHDVAMRAALRVISGVDSLLDVGCGYGRALTLLPRGWGGRYLGVDVSEDLVKVADLIHPDREFGVMDGIDCLKHCVGRGVTWDWVLLGWMKTMLEDNGFDRHWLELHSLAKQVARKGVIVVD